MSKDNTDVANIKSLVEQLNNIKNNEDDLKSFVKFKDDYSVISQALNSGEFKVKSFSHIIYVLSGLKKLDIKITINQNLCNKLFNNDKVVLCAPISLSDLKLICDFCENEAISNEVAKKLFIVGVNLNNKNFFNEVSILEIDSMKKKFSIGAQEIVKNNLDKNRKDLLNKLVSEEPAIYSEWFSKFVLKLYCFQICFCDQLNLNDTQAFMKLISGDTINIFVLATYFENEINNKNALPKYFDKKNSFLVKDENLLKQLFSNSAPELAAQILITHKTNKNKLNLDELKIIILARYVFKNDEDFKNKIKSLSKNEIDDNFWLNNFETMIPSEINHICYLLWLAKFLCKSQNQQNELKFSPDFTCLSNIFQLFEFFLGNNHCFKYNDINSILDTLGYNAIQHHKKVSCKPEDNCCKCIKSVKANSNKEVEPKIINEINSNQSQKRYISIIPHQPEKVGTFISFVFEDDIEDDIKESILVEIEYNVKEKDKNKEMSKNDTEHIISDKQIGVDEQINLLLKDKNEKQDKNNITESSNQINYKRLKITFIILGAISIISVAFIFINIFYFELAVFHFLNILLVALFVLSVFCIVMLSIAAKNINPPPKNFCLRGLFNCLILSKSEKTKSINQNLETDPRMQNQQIEL